MAKLIQLPDGAIVEVRSLYKVGRLTYSKAVIIPGAVLLLWGNPTKVTMQIAEDGNSVIIRPFHDDSTSENSAVD
jgi:hypothetical protein